MPALENGILNLLNISEYINSAKEGKAMYDSSLKYKWDNKNVLDYALNEGIEKGEYKKALEIARELKKEGLPIEFIVKTTRLSIEEIEKL